MLIISQWPETLSCALESTLYFSLIERLTEPFQTEAEARAFWNKTPTQIVIIEPSDNEGALETLTDSFVTQLRCALTYPESEDALVDGYSLYLSILNDEGAGLYLAIQKTSPLYGVLSHG